MSETTGGIGNLEGLGRVELEAAIRRHNRLYWEEHAPEISDTDYDRLVRRLKELAPDSSVLQEFGEPEAGAGAAVRHESPMLSLEKCYTGSEAEAWASKIEGDFVVMPKLDGLACSLRYDANGRLALAATRGTGLVGEEITPNVRAIGEVPQKLPVGGVEVRGEIFMRLSVFDAFKDRFSNPRNLAAGAIKQKDAKKSAGYNLSFAAYDVRGLGLATEAEKFSWLASSGFREMPVRVVPHGGLQRAFEACAAERGRLDYEIDGVVFRANRVSEQERVGLTAHHPRFAIAYKFQGDTGRTQLVDVEWSVSRSGVITPVALIEPVLLSGAMVSRASLHHPGFLKKLNLARGCDVLVTRRGGVIPKVEARVGEGGEPIEPPATCPSCGGPVRWEGDFLLCATPGGCRTVRVGELAHFCSVAELLGFGEKILAAGYDAGLLRSPVDLYRVTADRLAGLERVGDKTAANLLGQVAAKRTMPLATLLRALGIAELGLHVSDLLARRYGSLERIRAVTVEELAQLHSVGDVIATSVVEGLREKAELIDALLGEVTLTAPEAAESDGPWKGRSFVFTGKLVRMDRKLAQAEVRKRGGETPAGVSAELSYLVVGEEKEGAESSKLKAARKLEAKGNGPRIVDEEAFARMLEETP